MNGMVPGTTIKHSWVRHADGMCECKRRSYNVVTSNLTSAQVWTPKNCPCNQSAALLSRHQLGGAKTTASLDITTLTDLITGKCKPISREAVVNCYKSGKKARMESARTSLLEDSINKTDAKVRMFIKADKFHVEEYKAPRAIQYRSDRFGLEWARFVHPLEELIYEVKDWTETPIFAKKRNLAERAQDLEEKAIHFNRPLFVSLDHSKFDSHVTKELLRVERKVYQHCMPRAYRKNIKWFMDQEENNHGSTSTGIKFFTPGTRMSGDQNTALGNSVINAVLIGNAFKAIKHSMYVDGDDSVVIIEKDDVKVLDNMQAYMKTCGMETKIEQVTETFEEVDFCQCRPVWFPTGYRLIRTPQRAFDRSGWVVKHMDRVFTDRWIRSVALCELVLGRGCPLMQEFALKMLPLGSGKYAVTDRHHQAKQLQHSVERVQPLPIHPQTRESFWVAFGYTPEEQIQLELSLTVSRAVAVGDVQEHPYGRIP